VLSGLSGAPNDPERLIGCPNFATWVCPALFVDGVTGYPSTDTLAATKHASVATFTDRIRIPVFLMQGEHDTLFNLNEGIATYRALKAQGTPVKMLWQSWGHSSLTPPPGEISLSNPDPVAQYQTGRILAWFDHYLKGKPTDTGPEFAYFRDWVPYTGNAAPAYATAPSYPVGTGKRFYLSGNGNLVTDPLALTVGSQSFLTAPAGLPTSFGTLDALGSELPTAFPDTNLPGTFAAWTSGALSSPLSVVGSPTLDVRLIAPTAALTSALGPAGQLVLFAKVYDVAPDGTPSLIKDLVAPIRVADPTRPVQVTLPAFAHRFAPGHQIRVMVAGGDLNYRGGLVDAPVTIATGDTGQALTLPVVPD